MIARNEAVPEAELDAHEAKKAPKCSLKQRDGQIALQSLAEHDARPSCPNKPVISIADHTAPGGVLHLCREHADMWNQRDVRPEGVPRPAPDAEKKARRERIATAVLAGIVEIPGHGGGFDAVAVAAIAYADALIAALDG